jgi:hypothetical protein
MSKQNSRKESRQPVPAKKATSLAPTKQCFLVRGDCTQPSEDENDSHQEESYSVHFFSAKLYFGCPEAATGGQLAS